MNATAVSRLIKAARAAAGAISDELHAAGSDEVQEQPTLRRHSAIHDDLEAALAECERVGLK